MPLVACSPPPRKLSWSTIHGRRQSGSQPSKETSWHPLASQQTLVKPVPLKICSHHYPKKNVFEIKIYSHHYPLKDILIRGITQVHRFQASMTMQSVTACSSFPLWPWKTYILPSCTVIGGQSGWRCKYNIISWIAINLCHSNIMMFVSKE
jgi:hypothetical protein